MKPIKIYAEVLEESALKQFNDVMALDCVERGALMPDAHTGYVLPIGSVVAVRDYVFPAFVGYDIGCGVATVKLDIKAEDVDLEKAYEAITKNIPVGFNHHKEPRELTGLPEHSTNLTQGVKDAAAYQLGTLGGGNHFLELGVDEEGFLWATVHSGSRKLGHTVAGFYMKMAAATDEVKQQLAEEYEAKNLEFKKHNPVGYKLALKAYIAKKLNKVNLEEANGLHVDSQEGKDYILDLEYCLAFALANRENMLTEVTKILGSPTVLEFINRNHNHAELKDGLWIHRKGATHADKDMLGVIPANMRDGCFVVRGKGNEESMNSSSHGAGRVYSRKKAKAILSMDVFKEQMEGIVGTVTLDTLDESPDAYKDIFEVMDLQKDLVEVVTYLKPVLNVKG